MRKEGIMHHRLIRPDGKLIWVAIASEFTHITPPDVPPPWRYEVRVDNGDWILVREQTCHEYRRGTGRDRSHPVAPGGPIVGPTTGTGTSASGGTSFAMKSQLAVDGWWCWAPIGTPPPVMTVKDGVFTEPWPREWTSFQEPAGCSITYPPHFGRIPGIGIASGGCLLTGFEPPIGGCLLTGFEPSTGFSPPCTPSGVWLMVGWQSMANDVRVVATRARLTMQEAYIVDPLTSLTIHTTGFPVAPTPRVVAGAYRGWRAWKVNGKSLTAIINPYVWHPGWNEAANYNGMPGTQGGFYAMSTVQGLTRQDGGCLHQWIDGERVWGSIIATGRMVTGALGMRATRAKPETLITTGNIDVDLKLLDIADRYHLKVIDTIGAASELPSGLIDYTEDDDP